MAKLDEIVRADQVEHLRGLLHRAEFRELPGLAHSMLLTAPDRVAELVVDHLEGSGKRGLPAPPATGRERFR